MNILRRMLIKVVVSFMFAGLASAASAKMTAGFLEQLYQVIKQQNAYHEPIDLNGVQPSLPNEVQSMQYGMFSGYIDGVSELTAGQYWCAPSAVTVGDIELLVMEYFNRSSLDSQQEAASLIINILAQHFPCHSDGLMQYSTSIKSNASTPLGAEIFKQRG